MTSAAQTPAQSADQFKRGLSLFDSVTLVAGSLLVPADVSATARVPVGMAIVGASGSGIEANTSICSGMLQFRYSGMKEEVR